jgi:hypothetical protein
MKKYFIENDEIIFAETPEEFMRELRLGSMFDSETPEIIYMIEFAERLKTTHGKTINCSPHDYEGWVSELIRVGFIKKVEDFQPNLN